MDQHGFLPTTGGGQRPESQWLGVYDAQVAVATDPLNKGRVRLIVPQVLGNTLSHWAYPLNPGLNPAKGTAVFAMFLGGNPDLPYFFLGLSAQFLQNITTGTGLVVNSNPYFTGNVITGWTGLGGTVSAVQPNADTNPPFQYGIEITASGNGNSWITQSPAPTQIQANQNYEVTAVVYFPEGGQVDIGMVWDDGTNTISQFQVSPGTWTYLTNIVMAPSDVSATGYAIVGPDTSTPGQLFTAEAVQVISLPSARSIGGITTVQSPTSPDPTLSTVGDLWVDTANGDLIYQFDGTNWNPIMFDALSVLNSGSINGPLLAPGSVTGAAIAAGTITSNLIAANAIVAGLIAAGTLDGNTFNGININGNTITAADFIITATTGGIFIYGNGGNVAQTFTSSGNWTCPSGVTSVLVECWGAGGGGSGNNTGGSGGGAGGGGGEYAAEPTLAVTPGHVYSYTVGSAGNAGGSGSNGTIGGNSTFPGDSITVTAHGGHGGSANSGSGGTGGSGGAGSGNTTHHNGGRGANGATGSGTQSNTYTTTSQFQPPANITTVQVELWGGGGGGGASFTTAVHSAASAGGGGGEYAQEPSVGVTPGTSYTVQVGTGGSGASGPLGADQGGDGNNSQFIGDSITVTANGGNGAIGSPNGGTSGAFGSGGSGSSNSVHHNGGNGAAGTIGSHDGANSGGGGQGAGNHAQGGNASGTSGGTGVFEGGDGGDGHNPAFGSRAYGNNGNSPGGGGGGGAVSQQDTGSSGAHGGAGANGQAIITYTDTPAQAGGGGGSASATSVGNAGTLESGASAISGGGPGGGFTDGSGNWQAVPTAGPGGGGGGFDTNGGSGGGFAGQVKVTYNIAGTMIASFCGATTTDPVNNSVTPEGLTMYQNQEIFFRGSPSNSADASIQATDGNTLVITGPKNTSGSTPVSLTMVGSTTDPSSVLVGDLEMTGNAQVDGGAVTMLGRSAPGGVNNESTIYAINNGASDTQLAQVSATGITTNLTGWFQGNITNSPVSTTGTKSMGAWSIPANTVAAGTTFAIYGAGQFTTGTTPSSADFQVFWGGTGGVSLGDLSVPTITAGLTNQGFFLRSYIDWVSTTEAECIIELHWRQNAGGIGGSVTWHVQADNTGLTTSVAKNLTLSFAWGSAPGATSLTLTALRFGRLC